jgi:hypothetical protein
MKRQIYQATGKTIDEFSFQVNDELPQFLSTWLADWLKDYIEKGVDFLNDQTIQFGCWRVKCLVNDRKMRLEGPKSGELPLQWIDDVSTVLYSMMIHKYIPESFDLEFDIPAIDDTVTVGKHFAESPMFMNRLEHIDNGLDSGWFLGSTRDDVDNNDPQQLSCMSLYEALLKAPWIHDFLSLPVGTQVIFETDVPVVCRDFNQVNPLPDSYFASRNSRQNNSPDQR